MDYFRSPLNWVGNKYKYIPVINEIVKGHSYDKAVECFLGTGNILFNIDVRADQYVGNDKNKLAPKFYNTVRALNATYTRKDFDLIASRWNDFKLKKDYYDFRDYWNSKFLADNFDYEFMYETVMLLKMCSNSMIRFNAKDGYFNQGFRGLSKDNTTGFFTDNNRNKSAEGLNNLNAILQNNDYIFHNKNFIDLDEVNEDNNLLIMDPPYIAVTEIYDMDFNDYLDEKLADILRNTKNDFLYFNYLTRDGKHNKRLLDLVDKHNFNIVEINDKTLSGQNRVNTKEVSEVIIHNIGI